MPVFFMYDLHTDMFLAELAVIVLPQFRRLFDFLVITASSG